MWRADERAREGKGKEGNSRRRDDTTSHPEGKGEKQKVGETVLSVVNSSFRPVAWPLFFSPSLALGRQPSDTPGRVTQCVTRRKRAPESSFCSQQERGVGSASALAVVPLAAWCASQRGREHTVVSRLAVCEEDKKKKRSPPPTKKNQKTKMNWARSTKGLPAGGGGGGGGGKQPLPAMNSR